MLPQNDSTLAFITYSLAIGRSTTNPQHIKNVIMMIVTKKTDEEDDELVLLEAEKDNVKDILLVVVGGRGSY